MDKLHLEELESRHLLSNSSLFPLSSSFSLVTITTYAVVVTERPLFVEVGGRSAALGGIEVDFIESFTVPVVHSTGFDRFGVRAPAHLGGSATRPGADGSFADEEFLDGKDDSLPPVTPALASGARTTNGAATPAALLSVLLERSQPVLRPVFESTLSSRLLPVEAAGRATLPTVAQLTRQESGFGSSLPAEDTDAEPMDSPVVPPAPVESSSPLPSPKASGVLGVLAPFNVSAVELGMRQFLDGLKQLGPQVLGEDGGTSLWPWIVALAATGSALEIARRELRRPAALSAGEGSGLPGFPEERLFGG